MNNIILKFNKFLIDNDAALLYLENIKKEFWSRDDFRLSPPYFIIGAFTWNFEDKIDWSNLHCKWCSQLKTPFNENYSNNYITLSSLYDNLLNISHFNNISIF